MEQKTRIQHEWLTPLEASRRRGNISKNTLIKRVKTGEIISKTFGNILMVRWDSVEKYKKKSAGRPENPESVRQQKMKRKNRKDKIKQQKDQASLAKRIKEEFERAQKESPKDENTD